MQKRLKHKKGGYTLIELVLVAAVIGILFSAAAVNLGAVKENAGTLMKENAVQQQEILDEIPASKVQKNNLEKLDSILHEDQVDLKSLKTEMIKEN